ncbi:hypothetical protein Fot_01534 [Forsythia ovata]|uniref:FLZ-type domain-containing protein n=1 Tax=Forsythia ovata TaxID=205694 RepID=A0ABD1X544_9LAMI
MLKNRYRAVSSKQGLLGSPRFFNGFSTKNMFDAESLISPKSILDSQNSSNFHNPFGYDKNMSKPTTFFTEISNKLESEGIGLALIDSFNDQENDGNVSRSIGRMILFGAELNVKIPFYHDIHPSPSPSESTNSPADIGIKARNSSILSPFSLPSPAESSKSAAGFGIKTQNSPFLGPSPPHSPADFGIKTRNSPISNPNSGFEAKNSPQKAFTKQLSLKEMELSEDYTCVITHGPNPKTTRIFDNCIVESCLDAVKLSDTKTESGFSRNVSSSLSMDFLSFCYTCKDSLEQGKDIYMYRGEKAFCSHECRCQEMISEGMKNPELDYAF